MQRAHERHLRRAVVACRAWARRVDLSTAAVAAALGLSARTVRGWATGRPPPAARGRPSHALDAREVQLMRMAQLLHGPHVGIATLQAWCPAASRRVIARWQRAERQRRRRRLQVVHWTRAGRVWAMDFTEAPHPIEGAYPYVLHVRDLASHYHLAALPVPQPTAPAVCDLLRALGAIADAPLVLKVDNGGAFVSHDVRAWAAAAGTQLLYSPPRCPRYNGAIEASIGGLSARTHHGAAAAGHPDYWRCEDVETARVTANAIARRPAGRSAWQEWRRAASITAGERRRFTASCTNAVERTDRRPITAVQHRNAIVDTLQALAYVSITRRADLVH